MDFVDKKDEFAGLIEKYILDNSAREELLKKVMELSEDPDFKNKELFKNIFSELGNSLDEMSSRELKQRILMIRSFIE